MRPLRANSLRRKNGFALLITITLLAFLVLLLVSLATLTRVETQVASNNQQTAQARQNALMALNIAVGQLQKFAGPDQRVTARSDMDADLANTKTKSGRWTGVYGKAVLTAETVARDLYNDAPSKIGSDVAINADAKGNQTQLLNWLVSGNENTAFDPATAIDANGQIARSNAPSSFAFIPTGVLDLTSAPTALSTDITVTGASGNKPARLLVGPKSVKAPSDYVAAPLVDIEVAAGVAPGTSTAGSPTTIGRYAWWVGDEGIKARVNLPKATATQAPLAFVASQRAAVELMDGKNPVGSTTAFNANDLIGTDYDPAQAKLKAVMAPTQLTMLTPASTALPDAIRYRFHDISGYSANVLSDTYAGGLKRDLSAVLAPLSATGATSPLDTDLIFPHEPNTGSSTNEFGLPTWGLLRNFTQTTSSSSGIAPRVTTMALPTLNGSTIGSTPTSVTEGVAPVMSYVSLGFQYGAPGGDVVNGTVNLGIFPVVVLWNPYTTDIQAANYEVGMRKSYASLIELQRRDSSDTSAWGIAHVIDRRDFAKAGSTNLSAPDAYFRFIIKAGVIPAGQSIVYTLQNNGAVYDTSSNATMLANALESTSYNPAGHVILPSTITIAATNVGATYRVGVNGKTGTYYGSPVTFFYNQTCNFGGNIGGGPGTIETYLAPASLPTAPAGILPYTGNAGSGFVSQWHQGFAPMNSAPFNGTSPYSTTGSGYSVASTNNGLLQDEAPISVITQPRFRMMNRASFSSLDATNGSSRWIAQSNPRSLAVFSVPSSSNNNGISHFSAQPPASVGTWPQGLSVKAAPPGGGPPRTSSGTKLTDITSGPASTGGVVDTTLFEFRPESQPLLAIGQMQHANVAWHNSYPAYPIGNSIGDNNLSSVPGSVMRLTGGGVMNVPSNKVTAYYDMSWMLNRALWDRYFVSTIPHAGTGKKTPFADNELTTIPDTLPNPRYVISGSTTEPELRMANKAAAHLFLSGGFNINSTSEQAWRAVLGGMNQLSYDPASGNGGGASSDSVMSRFTKPTTNGSLSSTTAYAAFQGYRKLTAEQIATLAQYIVAEVRNRGPFLSLGDFINRRLGDAGTFPSANDKRLKGTLQAAIDAASLSTVPATAAVNSPTTAPFSTVVIDSYGVATTSPFRTGISDGGSTLARAPVSSTAAFAPQFLTQADLLTAIGSGLSARSDTFTVRTYGEAVNPATNEIQGRAWCEAVVQRMPDFVEPKNGPTGNAPFDATSALTANNKKFGRQFKIVSFRWLSPTDI